MATMTGESAPIVPDAPSETSPLLGPEIGRVRAGSEDASGTAVTTQSSNDDEHVRGKPRSANKMQVIILAVGIGIFLCAVDQLLTVATYAKIGSELQALNNTSWIATAYFITLTSTQPLYGRLSDIFGRKECLLFSYTVFGLGCLGCGLAQNFTQLCVARAIGGIGGGGMNSVVSILMSDIVPLRDRGIWQGYINIIFAAGTSTGAPLGGLLADSIGWRWSFLGQVPICAAAFIAVYFVLDLPRTDHSHWRAKIARIDFLGAATLVSAVIALLVGLDAGSNQGWGHPLTLTTLALTPVLFAAFIGVEMRIASHPFAPGHIIFDRSLFACYLTNFFAVAGHITTIFVLPLFFQAVQGASATRAGTLLVPPMIASVIASLGAGFIIRRTGRYYALTVVSVGLLLLAVVPTAVSAHVASTPGVVAGLVLVSLGAGSGITTTLVALLSNAATEDSAVVVACSYLFRSLGSSIGVSVSAAVLQQVLRDELAARLGAGADGVIERVRESLDYIHELPPGLAAEVRNSYRVATVGAMVPTTAFLVLAFAATLFVKEKTLEK
ncbi:Vacuolar membrane amino acid uptake transporter fnx2 like protein [Verticillium longisporum]|uniref:Vacuolar membrane amino acid uptake transporter fnx2 like protein n=1 Tax=Verticillium longisporum TaxID=100787 RepID=A0A8I2ZMU5_VERLO|nr:Vacuolar membrane amino acid uptake transporter fnx2 like protein [Verticillium longisporum]KAG7133821.1 Vacuolar membrane amino acid uptake transporter fnx2 like protein [Verticillium longisporum]